MNPTKDTTDPTVDSEAKQRNNSEAKGQEVVCNALDTCSMGRNAFNCLFGFKNRLALCCSATPWRFAPWRYVSQVLKPNLQVQLLTLHYITLHYITLHYITLHYITLHYITLHYITLHYITLHYITLHYYYYYYTSYISTTTTSGSLVFRQVSCQSRPWAKHQSRGVSPTRPFMDS